MTPRRGDAAIRVANRARRSSMWRRCCALHTADVEQGARSSIQRGLSRDVLLLATGNDTHTHTHTHTHPFNGPFFGTTRVSRYQIGKTSLDFTGARDRDWQRHQLGHMQACTSLQTDSHASTPPLSFLQAGYPSCHTTNSVKALKDN